MHLLASTLFLSAALPVPLLPPREHLHQHIPVYFTFSDQHMQQSDTHAQKEIKFRKITEQKIKQKQKEASSKIKKISKAKHPEEFKKQQEYKEKLEEDYQYNLQRLQHLISHRQDILRHFQQQKNPKRTNQDIAILRAQQTSQQLNLCPPPVSLQQVLTPAKRMPLPQKKSGTINDLLACNNSPHLHDQEGKDALLLSRLLIERSLSDSGVNSRQLRSPHPSHSDDSSKTTSAQKYATLFRRFY